LGPFSLSPFHSTHPTPSSRRELLRDPAVRFAGYKHPHPLENDIVVKIQTAPGTQPTPALNDASRRLEAEFRTLLSDFKEQVADIRREAEQIGGS
jgi:DNA-directed RNA polymerase subunit L